MDNKNRSKKKSLLWIPASIALILVMAIVFASVKLSMTFPHSKAQNELVDEAITYVYKNCNQFEKATDEYKKLLEKLRPYLEDESDVKDEDMLKDIYQTFFKFMGFEGKFSELSEEQKKKLEKSSFSLADFEALNKELKEYNKYYSDQTKFYFKFLGLMYEQPDDDGYKTEKKALLECIKNEYELCDNYSKSIFYSINQCFLPVNKEEALDKVKSECIEKLGSVSEQELSLESDEAAVKEKKASLEKQRAQINKRITDVTDEYNKRYNEYVEQSKAKKN